VQSRSTIHQVKESVPIVEPYARKEPTALGAPAKLVWLALRLLPQVNPKGVFYDLAQGSSLVGSPSLDLAEKFIADFDSGSHA